MFRNLVLVFIACIAMLTVGMVAYHSVRLFRSNFKYEISMPGYARKGGAIIYLTNSYEVDSTGAIKFKDELDHEHIIKGEYNIEQIK